MRRRIWGSLMTRLGSKVVADKVIEAAVRSSKKSQLT